MRFLYHVCNVCIRGVGGRCVGGRWLLEEVYTMCAAILGGGRSERTAEIDTVCRTERVWMSVDVESVCLLGSHPCTCARERVH